MEFSFINNSKTLSALRRLFLLSGVLLLCLEGIANTPAISLSLTNAPLHRVFKEIRKQSGYNFIYTKEQIAKAKNVTLEIKNASLVEVLELCFKDQPIT